MTDTRKAMQQALEALEQLDGIDTETECVTIDVGDTIEALREALAQQGEQQPVAWLDLHKELGQLKWAGRDEGWDMAIRAVQKRLVELDYAGAAPAAQPKGWVEP